MDHVIECESVVVKLGRRRALDDLSLKVPRGSCFGFIGVNGAGKTTTIRALAGLVRPRRGRLQVLGLAVPEGSWRLRHRVGVVLDTPAFYPFLSARRNLALLARVAGRPGSIDRIGMLLELVSLADRIHDPVRSYSFGMLQRLNLAAGLLHQPELLILDEPLNGLDPKGIADVRSALKTLMAEGVTVFLSSHLLGEVEELCDEICVIDGGRVVGQMPRALTLTGAIRVRAEPSDVAAQLMRDRGWSTRLDGSDLLIEGADEADVGALLLGAGVTLLKLQRERHRLEQMFLTMTARSEAGEREA